MHFCLCDYVVGIDVLKLLLPVLQVLWQSHGHISMALHPSYKSLLRRSICYPEHISCQHCDTASYLYLSTEGLLPISSLSLKINAKLTLGPLKWSILTAHFPSAVSVISCCTGWWPRPSKAEAWICNALAYMQPVMPAVGILSVFKTHLRNDCLHYHMCSSSDTLSDRKQGSDF